jgi:Peptidase A4 family
MKLAALIAGTVALAGNSALAANARADQRTPVRAHAAGIAIVLARSIHVRGGVAPVVLSCRSGPCDGVLALGGSRTPRGLYGAASFSLGTGARTSVSVHLTSAGRQLLRTNLSALVSATVTPRGSPSPASSVRLTLTPFVLVRNHWRRGFNKFWSGYAVFGQRFTAVRGTFIQPTMTACSGSSAGSPVPPVANNVFIWSGLDGFGSASIEQVGTEVACLIPAGGEPAIGYFAWYETFPDDLTPIPVAIHPGDVISTEVKGVSPQRFAMTLEDKTTTAKWSEVVYQHARAPQLSAEWIDEAQGVSIPTITTTDWSEASSTARGVSAPIGHSPDTEVAALTISASAFDEHVEPSALSAPGNAFSISWLPGP